MLQVVLRFSLQVPEDYKRGEGLYPASLLLLFTKPNRILKSIVKIDGIVLYYVQQNKEGDLYEYSKTVDY